MRKSGILLPVSSLPSPYGIGCFSQEAYDFVDCLEAAGQTCWQILPLGPTGYGDSPYQSFSTFAGNPYSIDLCDLQKRGWLTKEECDAADWGTSDTEVDYYLQYFHRNTLLKRAFERSEIRKVPDFVQFCEEEREWLADYALFMAVKEIFDGKSWVEWADDIRYRHDSAIRYYSGVYEDEILFYKFQQYLFDVQWKKLKIYANDKGIQIIGDIPIYVALDSADTWASPDLFQLDGARMPAAVAGCPPDAFSETGQLWGNPLYDWKRHAETGFTWWIRRIAYTRKWYDVIRIDHFRGFDAYYSIPFADETAENGCWEDGPGMALFTALREALGEVDIIAEDLGILTDSVFELLRSTGYPGMRVLQFAFGSRDDDYYLPHSYTANSIVYTGTHDNTTTLEWYKTLPPEEAAYLAEYLGCESLSPCEAVRALIRMALGSVSSMCIIPLQDYLELSERARINEPSTLGKNWKWRLEKEQITDALMERIRNLTKLYGRLPS